MSNHTLLKEWNGLEIKYPSNRLIHELFEEQAKNNPNKIALQCNKNKITYKDLNSKANQLARYIKEFYKEKLK